MFSNISDIYKELEEIENHRAFFWFDHGKRLFLTKMLEAIEKYKHEPDYLVLKDRIKTQLEMSNAGKF